jgi:periplasmic glucans biosynthesis protein
MSDDRTGAGLNRRGLLLGAGALSAVSAFAEHLLSMPAAWAQTPPEDPGQSFAAGHVQKLAEDLAARAFAKPAVELPEPFNALSAEQYRDIRFRHEAAVWRGENLDYELQLLAMGWLYDVPVEIWIVDGDKARALKANGASFSIGPAIQKAPEGAPFGFSGFRVSGPLNRAGVADDFVSFQGASYFKSIGRGQVFGLAAAKSFRSFAASGSKSRSRVSPSSSSTRSWTATACRAPTSSRSARARRPPSTLRAISIRDVSCSTLASRR